MSDLTLKAPRGFLSPERERTLRGLAGNYSAMDNFWRSVIHDTWGGEAYLSSRMLAETIDEVGEFRPSMDYNPLTDPNNYGYERFVTDSSSPQESRYLRKMVDANVTLEKELETGGAGISRFLSQFADPLTYAPVPFVRGIKFVPAAKKSFAPMAAIMTTSEMARAGLDPTLTPEELAINITAGTILGTAIGGMAGQISSRTVAPRIDKIGSRADRIFKKGEDVSPERFSEEITPGTDIEIRLGPITQDIKAPREDGSIPTAFRRTEIGEDQFGREIKKEVIYFDQERILAQFDEKPWRTPKVPGVRPLSRDFATPQEWAKFVMAHEKAHVVHKKNRGESKADYENRINEIALKEIEDVNVRSTQIREDDYPVAVENYNKAKIRLQEQESSRAKIREEVSGLRQTAKVLRKKADQHHHPSTQSRWRNEADRLDAKADDLSAKDIDEDALTKTLRNEVDQARKRVKDIEESPDIDALSLKETGLGLEQKAPKQLPWYVLVNTKLGKLAPGLAPIIQKTAFELAGSPGLTTKGAAEGKKVPTSVEMAALQWGSRYRTALDETNKIYYRYAGLGEGTRGQITTERFKQWIGMQPPENKVTLNEFRKSVGRALMDSDRPTDNPFIDEAVREWRAFFDKFGDDAKELGVFQSVSIAQNNVKYWKARLAEAHSLEETGRPYKKAYQQLKQDLSDATNGKLKIKDYEKLHAKTNWQKVPVNFLFGIKEGRKEYLGKAISIRDEALADLQKAIDENAPKEHLNDLTAKAQGYEKIISSVEKQVDELESIHADRIKKGESTLTIDKASTMLDEAEQMLEELQSVEAKSPRPYFHIMWRSDIVNKNEEMLADKLRTHFRENNEVWVNGKKEQVSLDPVKLEARVRNAIDQIKREMAYNDTMGLINKGGRDSLTERRIVKLQKEIEHLGDEEMIPGIKARDVKEMQIRSLQKKLDSGELKGVGGPSPILTRKLDINPADFNEFIEQDIELVGQHYQMRMGPIIEMARKFGDFRMESRIEEITRLLDNEIAKQNGNAALVKEKVRVIAAIKEMRDKVLGVYGIPDNPDAIHVRALDTLKSWNVLSVMGKAWMAATADSGKLVMTEGFTNTFGGMLRSATDRLEKGRSSEWYRAGLEVELSEALDMVNATRMMQISEIGGSHQHMGRLNKWLHQQTGPFFFLNLLSVWTDTIKRFAGGLIQSRMIENAIKWTDGTLNTKEIEKLATLGMDLDWAKRFVRQWEEAGAEKGDRLFLANTDAWSDREAVREFRAMLATGVRNAVITPGKADRFNMMDTPVGSVLMQYRSFGLSATQRIMLSGLQQKDANAVNAALSMVAIAALVDYVRRPDWVEMDAKDMMFRAVERSGVTGIFADIHSAVEIASGGNIGLRPLLGIQPMIKDPNWAQRTGAPLGAVGSQWLQFIYALSDPDATANETARGIRYMLPYNNVWWWSDTLTRAQRTLAEELEE